jgi:transcriptional regulator with XRE-family HTH domain
LNAQADIPRLVRELRERTGLTQEKFAAKLGVTFPTINRWENCRAKPSPLALKQWVIVATIFWRNTSAWRKPDVLIGFKKKIFGKTGGRRLYCNTPRTDNAVKFNM